MDLANTRHRNVGAVREPPLPGRRFSQRALFTLIILWRLFFASLCLCVSPQPALPNNLTPSQVSAKAREPQSFIQPSHPDQHQSLEQFLKLLFLKWPIFERAYF
jgi:hypothetical protein